LKCTGDTIIS